MALRGRLRAWVRARLVSRDVAGRRGGPRLLGRRGERRAARYLKARGLRILDRNVRSGGGEIDLVALDGSTLVFVEVKAVGPGSRCTPWERLDRAKRRALRKAVRGYIARLPKKPVSVRGDAVLLEYAPGRWRLRLERIVWHRGVF